MPLRLLWEKAYLNHEPAGRAPGGQARMAIANLFGQVSEQTSEQDLWIDKSGVVIVCQLVVLAAADQKQYYVSTAYP